MELFCFVHTTWGGDNLSLILYSCLVCQRLFGHSCLGLFLGSVFCSIGVYVVLVPVPHCLDDCSFVILSEV